MRIIKPTANEIMPRTRKLILLPILLPARAKEEPVHGIIEKTIINNMIKYNNRILGIVPTIFFVSRGGGWRQNPIVKGRFVSFIYAIIPTVLLLYFVTKIHWAWLLIPQMIPVVTTLYLLTDSI